MDSSNRRTGIDPETGGYVEEIPSSSAIFQSDKGGIRVDNPADGTYGVVLFGQGQKDFGLELGYQNEDTTEMTRLKGFYQGQPISFQIAVNQDGGPYVTIMYPAEIPTGLISSPYMLEESTFTNLSWNPTGEEGVSNYNIYAINDTEPFFSKIATVDSDTTTYNTTDPWCENQTIPLMTYAVTAVKNDGSESFFSETVQNNDRDHDGLNDIDELIMQTDMNDPDTDDDGLTDGAESILSTDPLLTDTDEDGFSDYNEIQAGSDPLDENSIPGCEDLPSFAGTYGSTSSDLNYSMSCDFDGDGDVDGSDLAEMSEGF